jgi:exportin-1
MVPGMVDGTVTAVHQRRQLYSASLSKLRMLMICRMAKPEEVLIVEDENGNIVRETMKDNDVLVQYKVRKRIAQYPSTLQFICSALHKLCNLLTDVKLPLFWYYQIMRETLIYLSHLDHEDTEQQVCSRILMFKNKRN